ncbi:Auxin response factor 10 [Platanthera guangdongensis]|uniref:Auxin response factor 10 n=1 Tax=Platanthera guangdongensis TaxID=2320717 RepID=A0ABR2LS82_9ASPA
MVDSTMDVRHADRKKGIPLALRSSEGRSTEVSDDGGRLHECCWRSRIRSHDPVDVSLETKTGTEQFLNTQLWHACAGGIVQIPSLNSKVYYFPQGHTEHAQSPVDFGSSVRIPPLILCRVTSVRFLADSVTDEVFTKIQMIPLKGNEPDYNEDGGLGFGYQGLRFATQTCIFCKDIDSI